jgi:hypothetical protein
MPPDRPPRRYRGTPRRRVLPAGTQLHRVHQRKWTACAFAPVVADDHFGGGRFDPTAGDEYPYLYAAFAERTALAEVLLRGVSFDDRGARFLPRATVRDRQLSHVRLAADLTLLALTTTAELAAVSQDEWLVQAEPGDYGKTRRWGRWLRDQAPWAQGLIWPSKRDLGEQAVILFGDRCDPGALRPGEVPPVDLGSRPGTMRVNDLLADYHVTIRLPADAARSRSTAGSEPGAVSPGA